MEDRVSPTDQFCGRSLQKRHGLDMNRGFAIGGSSPPIKAAEPKAAHSAMNLRRVTCDIANISFAVCLWQLVSWSCSFQGPVPVRLSVHTPTRYPLARFTVSAFLLIAMTFCNALANSSRLGLRSSR